MTHDPANHGTVAVRAAQRDRPRARRFLPAVLFAAAGALAGCATPRDALANLGELYASREEPVAAYAAEVTDRGFWARTGRAFRSIAADPPPLADVEPLEEPVEFALEQLAEVEAADADDLDPAERVAAAALLAEMARLDRARVLRLRALEVLARQIELLGGSGRPCALAPVDPATLEAKLDPLLRLAEGDLEAARGRLAGDATRLGAAAGELAALEPDAFGLALRLARLAAKCARRGRDLAADRELVASLDAAGIAAARHLAFLVARADEVLGRGLLDPAEEPRVAAAELLFALDPVAATVEIGRAWQYGVPRAVRIAWLRALASAPLDAANVHPSLRPALVSDLTLRSQDAALAWWSRAALAHLLGRDVETTPIAELEAAWLALGEWQPRVAAG